MFTSALIGWYLPTPLVLLFIIAQLYVACVANPRKACIFFMTWVISIWYLNHGYLTVITGCNG